MTCQGCDGNCACKTMDWLDPRDTFEEELVTIMDLHVEKSGGYGTDADPYANFTAVAQISGKPRYEYPILRTIEKLTRCISLLGKDAHENLAEEFSDCASLMVCALVMLREDLDTQ